VHRFLIFWQFAYPAQRLAGQRRQAEINAKGFAMYKVIIRTTILKNATFLSVDAMPYYKNDLRRFQILDSG
jgi:hypothetical protein